MMTSPLFPSTRCSVYLMIFLACTLQYAARVALNMNIVCMVVPAQQQYDSNVTANYTVEYHINNTQPCGKDFGFEGEFYWSRPQVGYILAAFFYAYIPMQIFAGWLADKFGIRHVLGTGMLIGGMLSLLTPLAARLHYGLLIALRLFMGFVMGVAFPCAHSSIGKWVPQSERSTFVGLVLSGSSVGTILSTLMSGFLCCFSWTIVFYIFGCLTIVWYVGFLFIVHNCPDEHPRISAEEKDYIKSTVGSSTKPENVPWRSMLTSPSVLGMCVNHFTILWLVGTLRVGIPLYLQEVMYVNIRENAVMSSLQSMISAIGQLSFGALFDVIHRKIITSKRILRKTAETLYAVSVIILFVVLSNMKCDQKTEAVLVLCLVGLALCFRTGGMLCSPSDVAPRMAGLVYGVTNFVGNFSGFLSPIAIGNLTGNGTPAEWQRVFLLAAGMVAIGWLCFMVLVGSNEEVWASADINEETLAGAETNQKVRARTQPNEETWLRAETNKLEP